MRRQPRLLAAGFVLDKPWFQPPDVVFGIIWPLNDLALLHGGWMSLAAALSVGIAVLD